MTNFTTGKPDAGATGTPYTQSIRDNLSALREMLIAGGSIPGFDVAYTGGPPTSIVYSEKTTVAAADTPTRGSGARIFLRKTLTYTAGLVTKVRYEISADSGSSYSAWTDLAGNSYKNITYSGGYPTATTWATS